MPVRKILPQFCSLAVALWLCFTVHSNAQTLPDLVWERTASLENLTENIFSIAAIGNTIFTVSGGSLYSSTNNGNMWNKVVSSNLPQNVFIDRVFSSGNALLIRANISGSMSKGVLLRSVDMGTTWTEVLQLLEGNFSSSISRSGNSIFFPYNRNIYFSRDNGNRWALLPVPSSTSSLSFLSGVEIGNALFTGWISTNGSQISTVMRSTDNGNTWTICNTINEPIDALGVKGSELLVGMRNKILRSSDNGTTWSETIIDLPVSFRFENSTIPIFGNTILGFTRFSTFDIVRSTDNGVTWRASEESPLVVYSITGAGTTIFAGTSGGVFRSTDSGATWVQVNRGLEHFTGSIGGLGVHFSKLFAITNCGMYSSANKGASWHQVNTIASNHLGGVMVESNDTLVSIPFKVYRSSDSGVTWLKTPQDYLNLEDWVGARDITADKSNIFAGRRSLYRSTDGGRSWRIARKDIFPFSLALKDGVLFVGTAQGLFRSADNGNSWMESNPILPVSSGVVNKILVKDNMVFALTDRFLFSSANNGASWTRLGSSIPADATTFLFYKDIIFVNTNRGIYSSTDNGRTWKEMNRGIEGILVNSLTIQDSTLFVASGSSVFRAAIPSLIPAPLLVAAPQTFALGTALLNTPGATQSYTLTGQNLTTATVSVTAPQGVEIAISQGGPFSSALTIPVVRGGISQTVFARLRSGTPLSLNTTIQNISGTISASVAVQGMVIAPVIPTFRVNPQQLLFGNVFRNAITTGATFTVTGANLSVPVSITAPLGVLLFNPTTGTWGQTLTISTNSTDIVAQQVSVRLDSSRVGLRGRVGAFGQQAFISVSSGNLSANVEISGNVQEPPMLSVQPTALTFGTARVGNAEPFTLPLQRSYTVTGTNLSETLIITAPDGVLLFDTVSNSWQQTLRFPLSLTPFTANFHTTLQARMDSSQVRNIAATILHRSGTAQASTQASTQATLSVSGAVIPLPLVQVSPQSLTFADVVINTPVQQQQYTIAGTNLPAPVIVNAPEGVLLWNTATASWVQTLTITTNASGSVAQTIAVRLDSSRVRTFSAEAISHSCRHSPSMQIVAEAFVQVRGAVVPLFLPANTETHLEMRLLSPRQPMLIRDTARVQLWLKDIRLTSTPSLSPRIIGQFLRNLRATLRLDTNNMAILGVVSGTGTRARLETAPQVPRTSALTTILIERTDTTSTSNMLLAELLLQATVSATTTNTIRAAEPTAWLESRLNVAPAQVSWQPDFLNVSIRPLFAPRRTTTLAAVIAPNPSEGAIELRYKVEDSGLEKYVPLTLVVSDMAGRVVLSTELGLRKTGEMQQERINLHRLPVGVYQIWIHAPNETINGRVEIRK
jgi:photosystem II stability/assembly factor-like uncharacterized protein